MHLKLKESEEKVYLKLFITIIEKVKATKIYFLYVTFLLGFTQEFLVFLVSRPTHTVLRKDDIQAMYLYA